MKKMTERSPDRENKKLRIENEKLRNRLDDKDYLILKLSKDNANMTKLVSKLKQSPNNSTNHSTDHTNFEGSKDEKLEDFRTAPRPPINSGKKTQANLRSEITKQDEYLLTEQGKFLKNKSVVEAQQISRRSRESRANKTNKANSPYASIKNRVSIERNYGDKVAKASKLHSRSNSSLAFIRPAKNIDSEINHFSTTGEKPSKKAMRRSFLEVGVRKKKHFRNEDYKSTFKSAFKASYKSPKHTYVQEKRKYEREEASPLTAKAKSQYRTRRRENPCKESSEEKLKSSLYDNRISFKPSTHEIELTPKTKSTKYKQSHRQSMENDLRYS